MDNNKRSYTVMHFDNVEDIGKEIQKIRKSKKISQKDFATALGKSERTIQKYEAGEIDFNLSTIREIADELDTPWYSLLDSKSKGDSDDADANKHITVEYHFHSVSDVINMLFTLTEIKDLSFDLSCAKPPESPEWKASLSVNGKGSGCYDADFCLFIENWMAELQKMRSGKSTPEQYAAWKDKMLSYYSESYFTDIESQMVKTLEKKKAATTTSAKVESIKIPKYTK